MNHAHRPSHRHVARPDAGVRLLASRHGRRWSGRTRPRGPAAFAGTLAGSRHAAGPVADGWVAAFGDPRLAALVAEAQEKNSDLQAAAAQVQRAAALARQARSGLRPAVQAVGLGSRSHIEIDDIEIGGQAGLPVPSSIEYDSTSFLGLAQASWEIDLWGRISDGWYAALENEAAARADYFAARQSIAAGVARAYLVSIEASRQVGLAEEAVDTLEHLHRLVGLQVREGVAMDGDLALIRANLEQAREALARAQGAARGDPCARTGRALSRGRVRLE